MMSNHRSTYSSHFREKKLREEWQAEEDRKNGINKRGGTGFKMDPDKKNKSKKKRK